MFVRDVLTRALWALQDLWWAITDRLIGRGRLIAGSALVSAGLLVAASTLLDTGPYLTAADEQTDGNSSPAATAAAAGTDDDMPDDDMPDDDMPDDELGRTPTTPASATPACAAAPISERLALLVVIALPGVQDSDDPLIEQTAELGAGGIMLRDDNIRSQSQARDLVTALRAQLGDHLLVAVDDEGGRVRTLRALTGDTPSHRALSTHNTGDIRAAGTTLGGAAHSIGANWVFAPVADLADGAAAAVIGDRSFGTNPVVVADQVTAFADGLRSAKVAATAKHFPGHGDSTDTHKAAGSRPATLAELEALDLMPFDALIDDGIESVMVGHVSYPNAIGELPASLNPQAYQLLRAHGFDGVAVTDALGMGAIYERWDFDVSPAKAVAAGADMILVNQGNRLDELAGGLLAAYEAGTLTDSRVNEAVARVLHLRGQNPTGILCP